MRSAASGCRTNRFSTELKSSRRTKLWLVPAVIILISTAGAQTSSPSTPQSAPAASSGNQTSQQAPAPPTTAQPPQTESPSAEPAAGGQNDASPQQPVSDGQEPAIQESGTSDQSGMFVFKKQVEEVVLHATVVDEQRHIVTGLDRSAFTVLENGVPQTITSFRREDVPVALGIVIDNSGSMRDKRDKINQAVLNLVRASNTQDEVFVVNFSDNPYLDQDFTSDEKLLQVALHRTSLKGTTALYDAVVASSAHLNKAHLDKRVLLVITDGQDNMSQETLQDAARRLQQANGPTLYAVGLLGSGMQARGRDALKRLADGSGGVAYFPETLDEVDNLTRTIAHDIRTQYMIAYRPSNQNSRPEYQALHVEAQAPGRGKLTVRTKSGYYPPDPAH